MSDSSELAEMFLAKINPPPVEFQVINVIGEAGEMAEAFRRMKGHARRPGTEYEFQEEMADVIISTYCLAAMMEYDLDEIVAQKWDVIFSRGYGNQAKGNSQ